MNESKNNNLHWNRKAPHRSDSVDYIDRLAPLQVAHHRIENRLSSYHYLRIYLDYVVAAAVNLLL